MENSNNRKFYKLSTEQQKDYLKNKKKYIAFRIRIPDNLLKRVRNLIKQNVIKLKNMILM